MNDTRSYVFLVTFIGLCMLQLFTINTTIESKLNLIQSEIQLLREEYKTNGQ
jgi:hypothetical protein